MSLFNRLVKEASRIAQENNLLRIKQEETARQTALNEMRTQLEQAVSTAMSEIKTLASEGKFKYHLFHFDFPHHMFGYFGHTKEINTIAKNLTKTFLDTGFEVHININDGEQRHIDIIVEWISFEQASKNNVAMKYRNLALAFNTKKYEEGAEDRKQKEEEWKRKQAQMEMERQQKQLEKNEQCRLMHEKYKDNEKVKEIMDCLDKVTEETLFQRASQGCSNYIFYQIPCDVPIGWFSRSINWDYTRWVLQEKATEKFGEKIRVSMKNINPEFDEGLEISLTWYNQ